MLGRQPLRFGRAARRSKILVCGSVAARSHRKLPAEGNLEGLTPCERPALCKEHAAAVSFVSVVEDVCVCLALCF